MADTFEYALAQQGTTPAQQQGKAQRSTADKAKSGLQGLSAFNTATGLMGNALIGGVPGMALGLANAVVNGPTMMANLANKIAGVFNDGTGAYSGLSTSIGGPSIGGTGGFDMSITGPAPTSGPSANFGAAMNSVTNQIAQAIAASQRGDSGPSSGPSPGGGGTVGEGGMNEGHSGDQGSKFNQGGLVSPQSAGGLQDLMRGYI